MTGLVQYYDMEKMILDETVRFVVAERDNVLIGCGFAASIAPKCV